MYFDIGMRRRRKNEISLDESDAVTRYTGRFDVQFLFSPIHDIIDGTFLMNHFDHPMNVHFPF